MGPAEGATLGLHLRFRKPTPKGNRGPKAATAMGRHSRKGPQRELCFLALTWQRARQSLTGEPTRGARPRLLETPAQCSCPGPITTWPIWWLCLGTVTAVLPLLVDFEVSIPPRRVILRRGWRPADSPACWSPWTRQCYISASVQAEGWSPPAEPAWSLEATRALRRAWLP